MQPVLNTIIDTNLLLQARSYYIALKSANTIYLELLPDQAKKIYDAIDNQYKQGNPFFVAKMSLIEMKTVHIKNALYEYARSVYQLPPAILGENKKEFLAKIRDKFNKEQLAAEVTDFHNIITTWGLESKLQIIPDSLSDTEKLTWRKKQELIFTTVGDYANIETQDAYIFASAMAAEIDEIWTSDSGFRLAVQNLTTTHYNKELEQSYPLLFSHISIPKACKPKI